MCIIGMEKVAALIVIKYCLSGGGDLDFSLSKCCFFSWIRISHQQSADLFLNMVFVHHRLVVASIRVVCLCHLVWSLLTWWLNTRYIYSTGISCIGYIAPACLLFYCLSSTCTNLVHIHVTSGQWQSVRKKTQVYFSQTTRSSCMLSTRMCTMCIEIYVSLCAYG